jgi:hypothetical protein
MCRDNDYDYYKDLTLLRLVNANVCRRSLQTYRTSNGATVWTVDSTNSTPAFWNKDSKSCEKFENPLAKCSEPGLNF